MLVLAAGRRRAARRARLEAPRVDAATGPVRDRAVGRDRRPGRARRPAGRRRRASPRSATTRGRASSSTSSSRSRRSTSCARRPVLGPIRMVKDDDEIAALQAAATAVDADRGRDARLDVRRPHRARGPPRARRAHARARATNERTSRSSRPARTRRARTTSRQPTGASRTASSCCATSAGRCAATAPTSRGCSHVGEPSAEVRDVYAVLVRPRRRRACAPRPSGRRARRSTPRPGASSPTPASASTSCIASGTASAGGARRSVHGRGQRRCRSQPGHAFSVEPGIYFPGRFGMRLEDIVVATDAGPAPPQRGAARPRGRRLTVASAMKLDGATFLLQWATGGLAVLLGHDAPPRGEPRVRLAAPQRLRRDGASARRPLFATQELTTARVGRARGDRSASCSAPRSRSSCRSCAGARACAAAKRCGPNGSARVAAMVGRERVGRRRERERLPEFPPALDLVAPVTRRRRAARGGGVRGRSVRARARPGSLVGAAFLGSVSDAMLLGHWYLVQPGLATRPGEGARALDRDRVAVRARGVPVADRHGAGVQRHRRRRLQRPARLDLDRVRGDDDRPRRRSRGSR